LYPRYNSNDIGTSNNIECMNKCRESDDAATTSPQQALPGNSDRLATG
jgi:hypothetical protein